MREIKFRVWDNVDYMSSPFSIKDVQLKVIQFDSDLPIMQFTGLEDKNDQEIYEGDILDTGETRHRPSWRKGHNYHVVCFSSGCFTAKGWNGEIEVSPSLSVLNHKSTVIGNIYENPELLNQTA